MRTRGALIGIGLVVVAAVALGIAALHSISSGCAYAAPVPSLSPALRAVGGYDQPVAGDAPSLEKTAVGVAPLDHPHLLGTKASAPVLVHGGSGTSPDAEVVALTDPSGPGVAGAVVFLHDCSGRTYFSQSEEFTSPLSAFPPVSAAEAARELSTSIDSLTLIYQDSPLHPEWKDTRSGRTVSALSGGG